MNLDIWIDGSSRPKLLKKKKSKVGPSSSSFIVKVNEQTIYRRAKYTGILDNNQAEYEAFLMALDYAVRMKASYLKIYTDSSLIEYQMNRDYHSNEEPDSEYYLKSKELLSMINSYEIKWIPRGGNKEADKLCRDLLNRMVENGKF